VGSRTRSSPGPRAKAAPEFESRPLVNRSEVAARIGHVARRIREELDLTLANVAQHAGISPGMLSRLETGHVNPSLETIVALAEALGVRPALLLQEVGEYEGGAQHVPDGGGMRSCAAAPNGGTPIICWPRNADRSRYLNHFWSR
jgi:DNA-binding XRE family transcriptional regulator